MTLSKLYFKRLSGERYQAKKVFGRYFVSVGYSGKTGPGMFIGNYKGDGKNTWEVAYGLVNDPDFTVVGFAKRQQVNTILKNVGMKGRLDAAAAQRVEVSRTVARAAQFELCDTIVDTEREAHKFGAGS
jgi:hypothetical protein